MRNIENLIFVILVGCLFICALFWRESSKIQTTQKALPPLTAQSQEDIATLPQILSFTKLPPLELRRGRDIFKLPWRKEGKPQAAPPAEKPAILSTIVWSATNPLSVINGEILAVGETDSESLFKVESITRDSVRIRRISNRKTVVLKLAANR
ncbi:MAG: hypothetical protein O7E52_06480 [Candidatus Poribacteria bacterium]|nr:hypothetical protein [Candidatus Poribacteria bacterium]